MITAKSEQNQRAPMNSKKTNPYEDDETCNSLQVRVQHTLIFVQTTLNDDDTYDAMRSSSHFLANGFAKEKFLNALASIVGMVNPPIADSSDSFTTDGNVKAQYAASLAAIKAFTSSFSC